jgi:hypothetical protein
MRICQLLSTSLTDLSAPGKKRNQGTAAISMLMNYAITPRYAPQIGTVVDTFSYLSRLTPDIPPTSDRNNMAQGKIHSPTPP